MHTRIGLPVLLGLALGCGGQLEDGPRAPARGESSPVLATLASPEAAPSVQLRSGDLAGARAAYEAALAANPEKVAALNDLAVSYYLGGRFDAARQLLDEVVARGGPREQQAALVNLGELYALDGYVTAARAYLESARGVDPTRPAPMYALALLADTRGQSASALALVREALKSDESGAARAGFAFLYPEERIHLEALVAEAQGDRETSLQRWRELKSARFPALAATAQRRLDETP